MSGNEISESLLTAPYALNIYLGLFIYVTGVFGSIGNMIIYTSKSLRDRACSSYLFSEAIVDFFYLNTILLTRIMMKGFRIAITSRYDVLCRLRQFASNYGNQLAVTFLALATIDRILLAQRSPRLRGWGNRTDLTKKFILASLLIWIVVLCHRLIMYRTANGRCEPQPGTYAYFDNLYDAIVTCLLPMIVLTTLGILIGISVRRVLRNKTRTIETQNESMNTKRLVVNKIDAQLMGMVFLQIIVGMLSFLPFAAHLIYINVTESWNKTPLRVAWETLPILCFICLISWFSKSILTCHWAS